MHILITGSALLPTGLRTEQTEESGINNTVGLLVSIIMPSRPLISLLRLGSVEYGTALELQANLARQRLLRNIPDVLVALEHFPVYTVGKRQTVHNILSSPAELHELGAEVYRTERGGDVTFHGPGQVILYPILNLHDLKLGARKYVNGLEDVMIDAAKAFGVAAKGRVCGQTGVWVGDRKLGAVGVKISAGVTSHGLAFNVNPDLSFFEHIVPCGIPDKGVTSLHKEMEGMQVPDVNSVREQLIQSFMDVFCMSPST